MPQVSIIMAAYNAEKTIQEAINAILCQTLCDFELFVCDDASTDATREIVQAIAETDSRVRLLQSEKNRGAATARNRCLAEVRGTYIAIMDADDLCSADRLLVQVDYLNHHPEVSLSRWR